MAGPRRRVPAHSMRTSPILESLSHRCSSAGVEFGRVTRAAQNFRTSLVRCSLEGESINVAGARGGFGRAICSGSYPTLMLISRVASISCPWSRLQV